MMYKKVTKYGMFVALAMVLSYVDAMIPVLPSIKGMKLGLANLVVFTLLYTDGIQDAATVSVVRMILMGLTFGNMYSMFYSLGGGILSFIVMVAAKQVKGVSKIGVSILGGVFHNIGQICVAAFVLNSSELLLYYIPVLLVVGAITGGLIGTVGSQIIRTIKTVF